MSPLPLSLNKVAFRKQTCWWSGTEQRSLFLLSSYSRMPENKKYSSLREFYPFYLSEHSKSMTRILHFIGTFLVFVVLGWTLATSKWWGFALIPLVGYGFAWISHMVYEKNKPATFKYPVYSLASDFIMFWELLIGKEKFNSSKASGS